MVYRIYVEKKKGFDVEAAGMLADLQQLRTAPQADPDATVYVKRINRERIIKRPPFLHRRFFEEWIPMENRYFDTLIREMK